MKHLKKAPDFLSNILDILRKLFNNVSDRLHYKLLKVYTQMYLMCK